MKCPECKEKHNISTGFTSNLTISPVCPKCFFPLEHEMKDGRVIVNVAVSNPNGIKVSVMLNGGEMDASTRNEDVV